MDIFLNLFYNTSMKRFIILIVLGIFGCSIASADDITGEQAKLLYADNNINESFNLLLTIPEDDRTAENWFLLGNILHDRGRNDDAIFMYTQAILKDDKFFKAYYNLGNSYLEADKPNMAIIEYKNAIKLNKDYAYAYYNMGCAYIKLGDYKKARNAILDAIFYKNTEPDFHYNLAYVYKKLNKPKDAQVYLEFYNKLIENKLQ